MFEWLWKKVPFYGSVLFPGRMAPRAEEFGYLEKAGIRVSPGPARKGQRWTLGLEHPAWGQAELRCSEDARPPPREMIEQVWGMTGQEKETVLGAGVEVGLWREGRKKNILRDRKEGLRFLRAIMGEEGAAGIDYLAQRVWPRGALEEELAHEADLDVSQIYAIHLVSEDGEEGEEEDEEERDVQWLHTHGLGEIGFFDFDVLNPSEDVLGPGSDVLRAVAYAIIEKKVGISTGRFRVADRGGVLRFVEVGDFMKRAAAEYTALRGDEGDSYHEAKRVVLCQPAGRLGGWSKKVAPSKYLAGPIDERSLITFSRAATELMAARARETYGTLRRLFEEFREFEFPVGVKLGYRVDGGNTDEREHLWFEVHRLEGEQIEGTLQSPPVAVSGLRLGERGRYPAGLMSDWLISTPAGMISPRDTLAARTIREQKEVMRNLMAIVRKEGKEAGRK